MPLQTMPRRYFAHALTMSAAGWLTGCDDPKREIKDVKGALQAAYGQKKFKDVLTLGQRGLDLSREALGDKHPDTLYFAQSISEAYTELANKKDAIVALDREIKLRLAAGQSEQKLQGRRTLAIKFAEETNNKPVAISHALAIARDIKMEPGKDPQPVYRPETAYPLNMVSQGTQADVTVEYAIDDTGAVTQAKVIRATSTGFDQAAIDSIKKWRFTPMLKNGAAVASGGHQFTLMFRLGGKKN
ncbi:MAG: energy transducer TonB [Alphaproteobacteria bacterium]|nr:energy transducer TonB [Alphaproteobacteria bacterium]